MRQMELFRVDLCTFVVVSRLLNSIYSSLLLLPPVKQNQVVHPTVVLDSFLVYAAHACLAGASQLTRLAVPSANAIWRRCAW
jgi:hypothetical protein